MAEYDNTNTFTLFKNDKGDNPKRPDYTGNANVDGIEFKIIEKSNSLLKNEKLRQQCVEECNSAIEINGRWSNRFKSE